MISLSQPGQREVENPARHVVPGGPHRSSAIIHFVLVHALRLSALHLKECARRARGSRGLGEEDGARGSLVNHPGVHLGGYIMISSLIHRADLNLVRPLLQVLDGEQVPRQREARAVRAPPPPAGPAARLRTRARLVEAVAQRGRAREPREVVIAELVAVGVRLLARTAQQERRVRARGELARTRDDLGLGGVQVHRPHHRARLGHVSRQIRRRDAKSVQPGSF
mmetsp:Transcript_41284/g.77343  ORF Transcript_41284/g.77343 Transcript_41284/m.77343 type:complete len:224 (+) Transcript_41284:545-1216(+)